jgi:alcohol dehydrogenase class IV
MPRPSNPAFRPAYQGSNPVADIFSLWALQTTVKYLPRVAKSRDDHEARWQMLCVVSTSAVVYGIVRWQADLPHHMQALALEMLGYICAMGLVIP